MPRRNRTWLAGAAAALLLTAFAAPGPHRADIRILAADQGDKNPQQLHAAVDLGMIAISILVTWTKRLAE